MMTMAEETKVIMEAGAELRKRGLAGTPQRIERVVTAARPTATVAEVVAAVNALVEKSKATVVEQVDPFAGRAVAGVFLTPKAPDGSGGAVVKVIRTGAKPTREFAAPVPYFARSEAASAAPASEDELAHLKDEAKRLQAILDDPATGAIDRQRAGYRLTAITTRIEQLEVALHPTPQAGKAPTAGT